MLQSDSVFSQNLTILYKCSEVVLLRSSQEILCVLLVNVSTSSEGLTGLPVSSFALYVLILYVL